MRLKTSPYRNCCGALLIWDFPQNTQEIRLLPPNLLKEELTCLVKLYNNYSLQTLILNEIQEEHYSEVVKEIGFINIAAANNKNSGNNIYLYARITSQEKK